MLSFWSRVYGSLYCLVPWVVNEKYIGPEMLLISIWDSFPQPNVTMQDADYFIQGHRLSLKWLEKQDPTVWNMDEIKALKKDLGDGTGEAKQNDNQNSYFNQQFYPTQKGDKGFPKFDCYTEYRKDKWITWAKRANASKGREYLLRVLDNSKGEIYPEGYLPVVEKTTIPMFEGMGLGPIQRGKSMQFGLNSLVNLYMSGIRSTVFPERMVNPDNVVMSSLKYGANEFWFMNNPGVDVQTVQRSSDATNTFNSVYGLMVSSMLNASGTTDTSNSQSVESSLGKTPQALKLQAAAQGTQDFWEQTMLENSLQQIMERWTALFATKMEAPVALRLFGEDIKQIAELYPDATSLFSENSGQVLASGDMFKNEKQEPITFDYKIETGSTAKPNMNQEVQDAMEVLQFVSENPQFVATMEQKDQKTISNAELFKEMLLKRGMKNSDKIIKDAQPPMVQGMPGQEMGQPQEALQPQIEVPQYQDEHVNQVAQMVLGGFNGIPQQ